jgi:hypothetical protein
VCVRAYVPSTRHRWVAGAPSARTEVLLDLQATAQWGSQTQIPGVGALRRGKWKVLHGHTATWKKADASADMCACSTHRVFRRICAVFTKKIVPSSRHDA